MYIYHASLSVHYFFFNHWGKVDLYVNFCHKAEGLSYMYTLFSNMVYPKILRLVPCYRVGPCYLSTQYIIACSCYVQAPSTSFLFSQQPQGYSLCTWQFWSRAWCPEWEKLQPLSDAIINIYLLKSFKLFSKSGFI